jgi:hypothetical protein
MYLDWEATMHLLMQVNCQGVKYWVSSVLMMEKLPVVLVGHWRVTGGSLGGNSLQGAKHVITIF